jgi:membrane-bound lytic murein transglycosylase D
VASLDSASILLSNLLSTSNQTLSPERLTGLIRVSLELYGILLPKTSPVAADSPLSGLLDALPNAPAASVQTHPHYQRFRILRLAGTADVTVDYTPAVAQSIRYFQSDGRRIFLTWLARSGAYMPMLQEALREAGLPEDLAYLAMVESGFNPRAYSRARAAGIWQFTRHTGALYGLRRNTWIDERRDPVKATGAAVRHLSRLYDLFGDWRLVVAAYNCGRGRLTAAIRKSGTTDFWALQHLPRETRNHVPRFMAAVLISNDPEMFGFREIEYQPPMAWEVVPVTECVDLRVAAECTGSSTATMKWLNPELRKGYTPPDPKVYPLRVPAGSAERFRANYSRVPDSRKIRMVHYRVRSGETVSHIARRMGVSTNLILEANRIRNPKRVRAGALLNIPLRPDRYARARFAAEADDDAVETSRRIRVVHRVKKGDTLWEIARGRGVTSDQLKAWNGLSDPGRILPGDQLVIWMPPGGGAPSVSGSGDQALSGDFYVVKPGDTLWRISQTFRTSVDDLKRWNGIQHASRLRAGAKLLVRPLDEARVD